MIQDFPQKIGDLKLFQDYKNHKSNIMGVN